jgi:hypothetical protein
VVLATRRRLPQVLETTGPQQQIVNGREKRMENMQTKKRQWCKRTTLKQAASQCVTTVQQSLFYLELGDSKSDGCFAPTTGYLASYAVGIGGKAAGD